MPVTHPRHSNIELEHEIARRASAHIYPRWATVCLTQTDLHQKDPFSSSHLRQVGRRQRNMSSCAAASMHSIQQRSLPPPYLGRGSQSGSRESATRPLRQPGLGCVLEVVLVLQQRGDSSGAATRSWNESPHHIQHHHSFHTNLRGIRGGCTTTLAPAARQVAFLPPGYTSQETLGLTRSPSSSSSSRTAPTNERALHKTASSSTSCPPSWSYLFFTSLSHLDVPGPRCLTPFKSGHERRPGPGPGSEP